MAGRPGRSGGARPGAGRPRNRPVLLDLGLHDDPREFLTAIMQSGALDMRLRLDAAKVLLRYAVTGKQAATGRYATRRPPLEIV